MVLHYYLQNQESAMV
jgi:hypothetical protein